MNKRTIQIDVIGPIEETELMKCKLYVDGRVCVIGMSRYDYEELMREKVFIRDGKSVDSAGVINTTNTCLLYTSPSPRDAHESRMPSSA